MMKSILIAVILLAAVWTRADVIVSQTFSPGLDIPDGDPSGVVDHGSFSVAATGNLVLGITVGLNISGGYNGDLYAYLVAPNGMTETLMDQPGSGLGGDDQPGMNLTLSDIASTSIQNVPDPVPEDYPDNPVLVGTYQSNQTLGTFGNSSANGLWSIYFAEVADGGGDATLNSWTLNIYVADVPEPVNVALVAFSALFLVVTGLRWAGRRRSARA